MKIVACSLALAALTVFSNAPANDAAPSGPPKELAQLSAFEGSWNCAGDVPAGPLGPAHKSLTHVKFHKDLDGVWVDNYGSWSTQTSAGWEGDKLVWLGDAAMNGKTMVSRDTFTKKGGELLHLGEFEIDGKWVTVQDETCKRALAKK